MARIRFLSRNTFKKSRYTTDIVDFLCVCTAFVLSVCLLSVSFYEQSYFLYFLPHPVSHRPLFFLMATIKAFIFALFGSAACCIPLILLFKVYISRLGAWREMKGQWYASLVFCVLVCSVERWLNVKWLTYPYNPGGALGYSGVKILSLVFDSTMIGILLSVWLISIFVIMTRLSGIMWLSYGLVWCARGIRQMSSMVYEQLIHRIKRKNFFTGKKHQKVTDQYSSFLSIAYEVLGNNQSDDNHLDDAVWDVLKQRATPTASSVFTDAPHSVPEPDITVAEPADNAPSMNTQHASYETSYAMPSLSLLHSSVSHKSTSSKEQVVEQERAYILEDKLRKFGIEGHVTAIKYGPVITLFEYEPAATAKISKIVALEDDLALALQAASIRIIAPIPGKNVVGFEIARASRERVDLAVLMNTEQWHNDTSILPLILGVDTVGVPVITDLASMPHLLVAGATGAGKSVALNSMLMSLLCKKSPHELQLILIDPKQLEFSPYYDIAHLLFPIVTYVPDAQAVLEWLVTAMQERYTQMAQIGARSISDYNAMAVKKGVQPLPYIVVVIDELADLMLLVGKNIEQLIARLVQMARASGIHMIIATQRPSVDVITGTIKANFACRLACRVASKIDSRTIIDTMGAEKLLGKGDMLYLDNAGTLRRVHGAYVSDTQVEVVTSHIRLQEKVHYQTIPDASPLSGNHHVDAADQKLLQDIIAYIQTIDEISISSLQRVFKIGYNRSARMMELLEQEGRILAAQGSKMRKVVK